MADKVKRNQFTLGKEYACRGLKLLKLGSELKFVAYRHKISSISCRYFNYHIENEWTQKKIYLR